MMRNRMKIKTLSIEDVAWLLGTDVSTVKPWASSGIIKSCRTSSRGEQMFRREDVANLLASLGA